MARSDTPLRKNSHPVMENAGCGCGKGRFVFPSKWWRDTLKLLRCNWCGRTASLAVLMTEVNERLRRWKVLGASDPGV